jgi:hypothetical protein
LDFLRLIDAKIGWWLAYADLCINAEVELGRCQPFWTFVAVILGVVCLAVLGTVVAKNLLDRHKGARGRSDGRRT